MLYEFLVVFFICSVRTSDGGDYKGYNVVVLTVQDEAGLAVLQTLQKKADDIGIDFWAFPRGLGVNVTLTMPGDMYKVMKPAFQLSNLNPRVETEDLQRNVNAELRGVFFKGRMGGGGFKLDTYHRHKEINRWMEGEIMDKCGERCEIINIGQTSEGRDMKVIHIYDPREPKTKPAVWIDAGIHAREWIAPATAIYLINQLVQDIGDSPDALVQLFDWYILPVANPDGYEYTFTKDGRFWRKTRSAGNGCKLCPGVDLNRNFDSHWMESGASDHPCYDIYAGPEPFSEPESRAMRDFLLEKKSELVAYFALHGYGQYWLLPWGYEEAYPEDYDDLKKASDAAIDVMKLSYNKEYAMGMTAEVLYAASGITQDWAKAKAGIKYAVTIELPPHREEGGVGFELPAERIVDTGSHIWEGITAFLLKLRQIENYE